MPDTFKRQDMISTPSLPPLDPTLYHAHHLLRADDLPFWQTLAGEYGDPILELGCGTGRILLPLAGMGYRVTGLDTDPDMLTFLRAAFPAEGLPNLPLHKADMRTFALQERFALALLPCNTYSTFPAHEREQIAQTVRRHLQPGGIFAFSIPNPHLLASLEPVGEDDLEETFLHPLTHYPIEVYSQWERTAEHLTFTWRYDHRYPDENVISQFARTRHHLDSPEMILEELQHAGLTPTALYGDYTRTPFDPEDSTYLIVLSENPAV